MFARAPIVLLAAVAATLASDIARTQVPEGTAVVGTYTERGADYRPGTPGLFLVPLAGGGPVTPITGLPPELSTDGAGAYRQGTASVSLRCSDGAVIVGMVTDNGATTAPGVLKLFVLHLAGSNVARTQQIVLGTAQNSPAYAWTVVLPDDRILVIASEGQFPLLNGPMAGHLAAIVDTSGPTPVFTPLPNPAGLPLPSGPTALGGLALDPTGRFVYFTLSDLSTAGPFHGGNLARLCRLDLASAMTVPAPMTASWCQIASWTNESAFGVACDDDGTVYVSSTDTTSAQHYIHEVRPDGCNPGVVTTVPTVAVATPQGQLLAWGLALDRASGWFVAPSFYNRPGFAGPQLNGLSRIDPTTGAAIGLAQEPAVGWGTIGLQGFGVAVNNAIESYGRSSAGPNQHWFDNFPNPGGQPTVGNTGFSLTTKAAPVAPQLSGIALSFGRGNLPVAGIELLVDPTTTTVLFLPGALTSTLPLPIPNVPSLSGLLLTAQSLHLEAGGALGASRGLSLTVM